MSTNLYLQRADFMVKYDAIVIGAGPAGSSCAQILQNSGLNVCIIDKQAFPRDKVCAGWITPSVCKTLSIDLTEYRRDNTLQTIQGFRTSLLGGEAVITRYKQPVSYGIRRCEFDHYLLNRCSASKRLGYTITTIEQYVDAWVINNEIQAPLLIGAGGHFCPVARLLGANPGRGEPIVAAQEFEVELLPKQQDDCQVAKEIPELYFCEDLKGYGWVFRKGKYINVGLGRQDNHALSKQVDDFISQLKQDKRIPADMNHRVHGHAYLLYGDGPRTVVGEGVLLIGDSAGLAYPQSGEGIRPAIESAVLAANTILTADHFGESALRQYEWQLNKRFGRRQTNTESPWQNKIPKRVQQFLAKRMLANHWLSRHVVLDRWFFHKHQPALSSLHETTSGAANVQ